MINYAIIAIVFWCMFGGGVLANNECLRPDPIEMVKKYAKINIPLIGIINIFTKEITLFPTFKHKMVLHIQGSLAEPLENFVYISAKKDDVELHADEILKINSMKENGCPWPGRQIFSHDINDLENKKFGLVAHKFLTKMLKVPQEELNEYRGFSYSFNEQKNNYEMIYKSGSLNEDENGNSKLSDEEKFLIENEMKKIIDEAAL